MQSLSNPDSRYHSTRPISGVEAETIKALEIFSPADIRGAAEALMRAIRQFGDYRPIMSHNIASRQPMVDAAGNVLACDVFGFEAAGEGWWQDPRLALKSPLARACRYESSAFWANADGFRTVTPNSYLKAISLQDFKARALVVSAIVVPVHLPLGQIGMAAYTLGDDIIDLASHFAAHADALTLLTRRFIAGYVKATQGVMQTLSDPELTQREAECLRWAARGKTDREIGIILDRSHSTIRFHMNNIAAKLASGNRAQSIFRGMQLGYLSALNG
jgi:DNA-binding CsgD family transcriptional regulator